MIVMKNIKSLLLTVALAIIPPLFVWLPFFLRFDSVWGIPIPKDGMQTIAANYDGPLYIVVAKSFYNLKYIADTFPFPLPQEYYAAHFPLFPLTIRVLSFLTQSFPWAMLLSTLLGSVFTIYYFKKFIAKYVSKKDVLWITFVFALLPARWL